MQPQGQPKLRRSTRERRPSTIYPPNEYVTLNDNEEPRSFEEAMADSKKAKWKRAMQEEIQSLHENHTYDLVELP